MSNLTDNGESEFNAALAEHIAATRMASTWFKNHPKALASELPTGIMERLKRAQEAYDKASKERQYE